MTEREESPSAAAERICRVLAANPKVCARELRGLAARLEEEARRLRVWANSLEGAA
jgi:hypothetical protein